MVIVMWFACENTPEDWTENHKSKFFHEWLRMANVFILCDLLWKVQKGNAANREGSSIIKVQ